MTQTRAGFAAIVGAPNAGKSTLVNRLVGSKVTIVTHKVQTTRFPVRGVMVRDGAQVVLVDTPGIFEPRKTFDRAMVRSAWAGAEDADVIVHLVDARPWAGRAEGPGREDDLRIVHRLRELSRPAVLALNKIDEVARPALLAVAQRLNEEGRYSDTFMISGLKGDGVSDLAGFLARRMPEGPFLFPEDQSADMPARLLAAEITREKLMLRLHQEIPYQLAVETEGWEERRDGSVKIDQVVHVGRENHRSIVLGRRGETIRDIGAAARAELGAILDRTVHLFLRVKVSERWQESRALAAEMGLDLDASSDT
jgi:GTPase